MELSIVQGGKTEGRVRTRTAEVLGAQCFGYGSSCCVSSKSVLLSILESPCHPSVPSQNLTVMSFFQMNWERL